MARLTYKKRGFLLLMINIALLGLFVWKLHPDRIQITHLNSTVIHRPLSLTQYGVYIRDTDSLRPLFVFKQKPWQVEKAIFENINACQLSKGDERWTMVFVVKSAISNIERRKAIRLTWGAVEKFDDALFEVVFVLGKTKNDKEQEEIEKENYKHGDILQYNEEDTPQFLPEKVLAGMQWASQLPKHWFYASMDDDIAINFANLVDYFETLVTNYTLSDNSINFGDMPIVCIYNYQEKDPPNRDPHSKWYMPIANYSKKFWPIYCRGGMYATTQGMVNKLYQVSRKTSRLYLDDVWITGLMRLKLRRGNTNIVAAPFSEKTDQEMHKDLDFTKLLVKHFWGNIKEKHINVTTSLVEAWTQHKKLFLNRIKCQR